MHYEYKTENFCSQIINFDIDSSEEMRKLI